MLYMAYKSYMAYDSHWSEAEAGLSGLSMPILSKIIITVL